MSWLINSNFAPARQCKMRQHAPTLILDFVAGNIVIFHRRDELFDIVGHEIQFVNIVFFGRMNSDFRWRQTKDEPAMPDIDVWKL